MYKKLRALLVDLHGDGRGEKPDVAHIQERSARAIEMAGFGLVGPIAGLAGCFTDILLAFVLPVYDLLRIRVW